MNIIKSTIILGLVVPGMAVAHGFDKGKKGVPVVRVPVAQGFEKPGPDGYYAHGEGGGQWLAIHKKFVGSLKKDQKLHLVHLQGIQAAKESGDIDGSFLADHQELVQGHFLKSLNPKQKGMLHKLGVSQKIIDNGGDTDGDTPNIAQDKLTAKQYMLTKKQAALVDMFGIEDADSGDDVDPDDT